jgi:hypothetical protein
MGFLTQWILNYINMSWYENSSLLSAASGLLVMIQLIDMSLVWGRENIFLQMVPKVLANFQICLHHLWCQIHVHVWIPLWRCIETNLDPMIIFLESIAFNVHLAYSIHFVIWSWILTIIGPCICGSRTLTNKNKMQ